MPVPCTWPGCTRVCNAKTTLEIHLRTHTGEKPIKCDFEACNYRCADPSTMRQHKQRHENIKPHKCSYCDKTFICKSVRERHERTHNGQKPYECPHCDREFARKDSLDDHIRTHSGQRPFKCEFEGCDATFKTSGHLTNHRNIHTKQKEYICECGKVFYSGSALANHEKIHSQTRNFKCTWPDCSASFIQKGGLTQHMRIHLDQKPFSCDNCDMKFRTSGDLVRHIRTHTGERPFVCPDPNCDVSFSQTKGLKEHIERYHTVKGIQNHKKQEQWIAGVLDAANIPYKREHQIDFTCVETPGQDDRKFAKIDFVLDHVKGGLVFIEIDEDQHRFGKYSISCDIVRMSKVLESVTLEGNTLPILFLRLNSNAYQVDGKKKLTRKYRRAEKLLEILKNFSFENSPALQVQYMYYDIEDDELSIHRDPDYNSYIKSCCLEPIY